MLSGELNSNIEIRNSKQTRITKIQMSQTGKKSERLGLSVVLVIGTFEFRIYFGFRYSDFGFC